MYRNLFSWNFNDFYKNLKILTSGFSIRTLSRSHMPFFLQSAEIKIVPSQAAARLGIFTRDFPTGMLTVEIKWCPNLIIFDDYILLEASLPLPRASQTFLCRELTGALLEPNICASHSPVSLLHETLNPDNQPKHIQAFILKIPTAKTRGLDCAQRVKLKTLDMLNKCCREEQHTSQVWRDPGTFLMRWSSVIFLSAEQQRKYDLHCSTTGLSCAVCTSRMINLLFHYVGVKCLNFFACLANWALTSGWLIRSNEFPPDDQMLHQMFRSSQCS